MGDVVLCSNCFNDQGLRLESSAIGIEDNSICPNCGSTDGRKLDKGLIESLAHQFFVRGTIHRPDFGAAPVIQFNKHQRTNINIAQWCEPDLKLFEKAIGIGFFYYGPHLWMVGEVEPLKALQRKDDRKAILDRIIEKYPKSILAPSEILYRIRLNPLNPTTQSEYDSPPKHLVGKGRLDSIDFPVLYGSQDLQLCVHECRTTVEDNIFVASLQPAKDLLLLDLTALLQEDEGVTEFESLDMAIQMIFLAGEHAYYISREIAKAAHDAGYDGIIYPSYFSLVRTGSTPFPTVYGISIRKFPSLSEYAKNQSIPNVALFGRPIKQGSVIVKCINKVLLNRVDYELSFGPVGYD
jgi:RES domain